MIISHHGGEFVKITFGDTTIAFNPPSKDSDIKSSRFGCDIAFISINHPDMDGVSQVSRGGKEPFVIRGPGEYEVASVTVAGHPSASSYGGKERLNTAFVVDFDDMTILYLGALVDEKLPAAITEELEDIDILFVPIGGEGTLGPREAAKLTVALEPRVVIPILCDDKEALKTFLKEYGEEGVKPAEKLTIKAKEAAAMEGAVVVLSA